MLYAETTGSAENPPLLFLHGFMGNSRDWAPIVARLHDRYRCLAVDLPGHGKSSVRKPAQCTMPAAAAAVIALMEAWGVERTGLVGYSMGGRLALYLAIHFPGRFTHLVLESSSPGLRTAAERQARRRWDDSIARKLEQLPFAEFLGEWYAMPLFETLRAHPSYSDLLQRRLHNDPAQLAMSMRQMGTGSQPSLWEEWERLEIPSLLLAGELDEKYVGISAEMHAHNPQATRLIIPGAGHNIHAEQPDTFATLL